MRSLMNAGIMPQQIIKQKMKVQRRIPVTLLSLTGLVLLLASFFIRSDESASLARSFGFGFIFAAILFFLFKEKFGYKPSREEIEKKIFGKK